MSRASRNNATAAACSPLPEQVGEAVEPGRDIRVLVAVEPAFHLQGFAQELLGANEVSPGHQDLGQIVERIRDLRVIALIELVQHRKAYQAAAQTALAESRRGRQQAETNEQALAG